MICKKLLGARGGGVRYLYNKGNLCTSVTGGWNASVSFSPTQTRVSVSNGDGTISTTRYTFRSYNFAGLSGGTCLSVNELAYPYCPVEFTANTIDLTPWKKLCMSYEMGNISMLNNYNKLRLGVYTSKTAYVPNGLTSTTNPTVQAVEIANNASGIRTAEVDLSSVNQQGYVGVYFTCATITQTSPAPDLKIHQIWLE